MNPIALFIFLLPIKQERGLVDFIKIVMQASLIAFSIYIMFAVFGQEIFSSVLKVDFNSFRIFGGIVLLGFSLTTIVGGKKSMVATKGQINDIAAQIALPFMVGAATITMSILMARELGQIAAIFLIGSVMSITFGMVVMLALIRHNLKGNYKIGLDRILDIAMRMNGFFVGTIGVDLIISGVTNVITS